MKKRGIVMSNELGNTLYTIVLKEIQKLCSGSLDKKQLADFVLDKSVATSIFNISDVVRKQFKKKVSKKISFNWEDNPDNAPRLMDVLNGANGFKEEYDEAVRKAGESITVADRVKASTGYEMTDLVDGFVTLKSNWEAYTDNIFLYYEIEAPSEYKGYAPKIYGTILINRLDDDRLICFSGICHQSGVIMLESVPITVGLQGITLNLRHIKEFADRLRSQYSDMLLDDSIMVFAVANRMFKDLTNQDKSNYRCYVDEEENSRVKIFRKMLSKKEKVRIPVKPIILVLHDENADEKINKYKNPRGTIRYSFSWVVRGHYRRLHNPATMGYNRSGEKVMQGMTWVETYLKGDTNLPLLKRETIVIDKRNKNVQGESKQIQVCR